VIVVAVVVLVIVVVVVAVVAEMLIKAKHCEMLQAHVTTEIPNQDRRPDE
jgi:hypothetical protein